MSDAGTGNFCVEVDVDVVTESLQQCLSSGIGGTCISHPQSLSRVNSKQLSQLVILSFTHRSHRKYIKPGTQQLQQTPVELNTSNRPSSR
jgi:hypothetical protein